jgi:hypothetical protein
MGLNFPLAFPVSGSVAVGAFPLPSPAITLIVGTPAPTVRRNSRRENSGVVVFDFLGSMLNDLPFGLPLAPFRVDREEIECDATLLSF